MRSGKFVGRTQETTAPILIDVVVVFEVYVCFVLVRLGDFGESGARSIRVMWRKCGVDERSRGSL